MRTQHIKMCDFLDVAKALSLELRMDIFELLQEHTLSVHEIADRLQLPISTISSNVARLERAGLIHCELMPGEHGTKKICSCIFDRFIIDCKRPSEKRSDSIQINMPIGRFTDCRIEPTCGLLGETGVIGLLDDVKSFYEPDVVDAQLLWFKKGFVDYRFPNRVLYGMALSQITISVEICSEAPKFKLDWPSDITLWINGVEVGTYTSPGDFGGERGVYSPLWWDIDSTQYGLLKNWSVTETGSFIDGLKISDQRISDLHIDEGDYFSVRFGIKDDALNQRGMNLFGRKFGNYEQDIVATVSFAKQL